MDEQNGSFPRILSLKKKKKGEREKILINEIHICREIEIEIKCACAFN